MRYSHRNGESEPPTLHEEYYWFLGSEDAIQRQPDGCYYIYPDLDKDNPACLAGWGGQPIADMVGHWWGPVTPPWSDEEEKA